MSLWVRGNPHLTSRFCKDELGPILNSKIISSLKWLHLPFLPCAAIWQSFLQLSGGPFYDILVLILTLKIMILLKEPLVLYIGVEYWQLLVMDMFSMWFVLLVFRFYIYVIKYLYFFLKLRRWPHRYPLYHYSILGVIHYLSLTTQTQWKCWL